MSQEPAKADHETKLKIAANKMVISVFKETSPYLNIPTRRIKKVMTGKKIHANQSSQMRTKQSDLWSPSGKARGSHETPTRGEHPVSEDQFTHGWNPWSSWFGIELSSEY